MNNNVPDVKKPAAWLDENGTGQQHPQNSSPADITEHVSPVDSDESAASVIPPADYPTDETRCLPCPECKGQRRVGSGYLREDCPVCKGTGQQPDIGSVADMDQRAAEIATQPAAPCGGVVRGTMLVKTPVGHSTLRGQMEYEVRPVPAVSAADYDRLQSALTAEKAKLSAAQIKWLRDYRIQNDEIVRLKDALADAEQELEAASVAIGSDRYMDPPDGGSVSLSERVQRMAEHIAELSAELESVLSDWNSIVAASGSPTNGGAVGVVAENRRIADLVRQLAAMGAS